MIKNVLVEKMNKIHNGSFFKIQYITEIPLKADAKRAGIKIFKLTNATVRKGIHYANQKSIQMKVENGYELSHELPWGEWDPEYPGLLINHKNKTYVRLYSTPNKAKSEYIIVTPRGHKVLTFNELKNSNHVLNSWIAKHEQEIKVDAMTLNIDSVRTIG